MFKIISAKLAARETIKAQLAKEIPLLNDAISKEMKKGRTFLYYDGEISEPTAKLLEKSGFHVRKLLDRTDIRWDDAYDDLCENEKELKKIMDIELKIEIVCPVVATPKKETD